MDVLNHFGQTTRPAGELGENARYSLRKSTDTEYAELAKDPEKNAARLNAMVKQAAIDAGYTQLFYHGSKKGGGFTVFRDWQYFTENRDYAKRYTDRSNEKSLYTTYVKMENPFDTRIDSVRDLFEDARMEYGMGELQENGLPDWTDGYDIADYIDENDLPYDSIVLDEGGDLVNGKPVSRGLSYVVRKSNQVKSADAVTYDDDGNVIPLSQRFDTGNEDIRYSTRKPTKTARQILSEVFSEQSEQYQAYASELKAYQDTLDKLNRANARLEELRAEEKTLRNTKSGAAQPSVKTESFEKMWAGYESAAREDAPNLKELNAVLSKSKPETVLKQSLVDTVARKLAKSVGIKNSTQLSEKLMDYYKWLSNGTDVADAPHNRYQGRRFAGCRIQMPARQPYPQKYEICCISYNEMGDAK